MFDHLSFILISNNGFSTCSHSQICLIDITIYSLIKVINMLPVTEYFKLFDLIIMQGVHNKHKPFALKHTNSQGLTNYT